MATEKTPLLHSGSTPSVGYAPTPKNQGKDESAPTVSLRQLLRFSDTKDSLLLAVGVLGCFLYGIITPGQFIVLGGFTQDIVDYSICMTRNCSDPLDLEDSATTVSYWYIGLAAANFFFAWLGIGLFGYSAERQTHKMRLALFRNVIHQEIGWFDSHSSGEILSRLSEDINKIGDGIGSKFGRIICSLIGFLGGYVIGFIYCWQLTLVMLTQLPMLFLVGAVMATVTGSYTSKELEAYSKAGHVAEQSIGSIRTVAAFGGENKQAELYENHLGDASRFGVKKGLGLGLGLGGFQLALYSNVAVSLWYCVKLVRDGDVDPGDGLTVFFCVIFGSMTTGQAAPSFESLGTAKTAGYTVFRLIDRISKIDASAGRGTNPVVKGDVEFSNVDFVYPSRPNIQILKNFSLKIPSGKRVAFVGESGCGKSTVIKLIQRFYDPVAGSVKLDGNDIKTINLSYLRSLIGVVNQEPVLFAGTIAENIAYGREGVSRGEIEDAAKMANAHDFITDFPQGYDTPCGERGGKMSGGQKQRIAIARALVRNPKILLLDEATSALDTESEAVVQDALNKAGEGRTTMIIAHRLSTIKNADIIVSVKHGSVAETGSHDELMALDGIYKSLVVLQDRSGVEEPDDDGDNEDEEDEDASEPNKPDASHLEMSMVTTTTHSTISHKSETPDGQAIKKVPLFKILQKNSSEYHYIFLGCIGAALFGLYPPLYGYSLGGIFEVLAKDPTIPEEDEDMKNDSRDLAVFYFFVGVESGLGILMQYYFLSKAGEALTKRLRTQTFLHILRQEISYFDKPENGTGALCTRLAVDVSRIQGATGAQFGLIVSSLACLSGACVVSFNGYWKLALVLFTTVPLLLLAGVCFNAFLGGGTIGPERSGAGQVAAEAISNIQTVVSLGLEEEFFERFRTSQVEPFKQAKRSSHLAGLANGTLMAALDVSFAVGFRYGGYLIVEGDLTVKELMQSVFAVIASAVIVGQMFSMTPDYTKAREATNKVFSFLEKIPSIDSFSDRGEQPASCNGDVRLANVRFRYPTRRKLKVLRNLSFDVQPGQTVALVGTSGCGKSTSVSLIERYYDARAGSVMVDGHDLKELNLRWLRSQIGIVSQEPILFDLSVRDNIAYGDTTRTVSEHEIKEAARSANIHDFISNLPNGYDTQVGDKGTLISGGQKQRIAIARALIRDPKILLLDEATSALDTESEKVVQLALDKASVGRTTLVIAHRLSTIQHADAIIVIRKGKVLERGTHEELIALKGIYYALHRAQSLTS